LIAALLPVSEPAFTVTVPLKGEPTVPGQVNVNGNVRLPVMTEAATPVMFLVTVTATLLRVSGLVTPTVAFANKGVVSVPPVIVGEPQV
jgi:hypothetical protein